MTGRLPFDISFLLPHGWKLVDPGTVGEGAAAYVAVRADNVADPFVTNFEISGLGVEGAVDVAALAREHVATLEARYPVTVVRRDNLSAGATAEVAQLVDVDYPLGDSSITLKQTQIITAYQDPHDATKFGVIQLVMTCPDTVFGEAGPEFAEFLTTIEPRQEASTGE
jgi:hypothetical protein